MVVFTGKKKEILYLINSTTVNQGSQKIPKITQKHNTKKVVNNRQKLRERSRRFH